MSHPKKSKDVGPYIIDRKFEGELTEETTAVLIDNVIDREKMKPRVKIFYTSNEKLLAGNNTVAVFRRKVIAAPAAEEAPVNVTNLLAVHFNKLKSRNATCGS